MRRLHFDLVGSETAPNTLVLLHGILGRAMNLRGLARALVNETTRAFVFDLPHHGQSVGSAFDDIRTVRECARCVADQLQGVSVSAVIGHSFGGRMALWLESMLLPKHTFLLDSPPGPRVEMRATQTTEKAMSFLRGVAQEQFETREAFVRAAREYELSEPIALWLAMNLAHREGHYRLGIDVARIEPLLESLFRDDAWPCVETARSELHFLVAERDSAFSGAESTRLTLEAARSTRVHIHKIDAGHWLHADNPQAVLRVVREALSKTG